MKRILFFVMIPLMLCASSEAQKVIWCEQEGLEGFVSSGDCNGDEVAVSQQYREYGTTIAISSSTTCIFVAGNSSFEPFSAVTSCGSQTPFRLLPGHPLFCGETMYELDLLEAKFIVPGLDKCIITIPDDQELTAQHGIVSLVYQPTNGDPFVNPARMSPCFPRAFNAAHNQRERSGCVFANDAVIQLNSGFNWVVGSALTDDIGDPLNPQVNDSYFRVVDSSQNVICTKKIGCEADDSCAFDDQAFAIATGAGRMVIVGRSDGDIINGGPATDTDAYYAFYDTACDLIHGEVFGTDGIDTANGVAIDEFGNIYIAGSTTGELEPGAGTFLDEVFFIASFDSDGNCRFKRQLFGDDDDIIRSINPNERASVVVNNGLVFVCAHNTNSNGNFGSFLACFSATTGELIDATPNSPNDPYSGFVSITNVMEDLGVDVLTSGVKMYDLAIGPLGRLVIYGDAATNLPGTENDGFKPYLLRFSPDLNFDPNTLTGAEVIKEFLPSDYDAPNHAGLTISGSTGRSLAVSGGGDYFLTGGVRLSDGIAGPESISRGDAFTMRFRPAPDKLIKGDLNGDGVVDLLDIAPFVDALQSGVYCAAADINCDGVVNILDVCPFLVLLGGK